ncbi:N-acetylglucosamine-6-phosphate deacetylase-like isoform X2 [Corticium candelabrum]|uniref:N-acetylglucosamine-6-phosphate deacetylase-like isoform X2 n=1 Tax=Corticium candelabrum TaxID=121492 RepID=UPI002E26A03A|nr:N-acetylglucosamine-6-phosphate deacetylase-like isoform X2 [Corticium candelabrum]
MNSATVFGRRAVVEGGQMRNEEDEKEKNSTSRNSGTLLDADLVIPGFVDIHTHGLGGAADAVSFWSNPEFTLSRLPRLGTTSCLATIVFPPSETDSIIAQETRQVLQSLNVAMERPSHGAVLEGIHAEGPVINDCGALPSSTPNMTLTDFTHLIKLIPRLKIMTISPHLESQCNYNRLKTLLDHNVLPALGHDKVASESSILSALRICPLRRLHITHCFNVSTFHHRNPSLVNFGLTHCFPNLPRYEGLQPPTVEVIADLAHIHPLTLQTMLTVRQYTDIAIVSDAIHEPIAGKRLKYMGRDLEVSHDCSRVTLVGSDVLAGSCCSLLQSFRSLVDVLGVPVGHAACMLSETPARIAALDHVGSIAVGKRADLLLLDSNLNLEKTIVNGQVIYDSKSSLK